MDPVTAPRPLTLPRILAAHAVPAVGITAAWALSAPLLLRFGLPPVWGLLLAVPLLLGPLGVRAVRRARREGTPLGLGRPTRRDLLRRALPALLAGFVLAGAVSPLEPVIGAALAGRLPGWWTAGLADVVDAPLGVRIATLVLWIVSAVLIGPIMEEVVFRGRLQPRLPGGRAARVLLGSLLFSVYHLWQPAAWLTVFAATLPVAMLRESRSPAGTSMAIVVHVATNAVALLLLGAGLLVR